MRSICLILMVILSPVPLVAEIEWVTLDWNQGACLGDCLGSVEKHLSEMYSVSKVEMGSSGAAAKLIWKPNQPFLYRTIQNAVAWVGLGIRNVGIKVRGTITHDSSNVYLTSIGDRTRFSLFDGEPTPDNSSGQLYTLGNTAAYPLTPETREKLRDAEKKYKVATIEGYLLMPWRGDLNLIITKISLADKNKAR